MATKRFYDEEWRDVIGHEGFYQISNYGHVKNITPLKEPERHHRSIKGNILRIDIRNGYPSVTLSKNNRHYHKTIHRLICESFIPNLKNKNYVNHKDGNKQNNNLTNLEWCTNYENMVHSYKIGTSDRKGEKHNNSKLTITKAKYIRQNPTIPLSKLSKELNVSMSAIQSVRKLRTWNYAECF